jgi:PAS domain S-box-containing protein
MSATQFDHQIVSNAEETLELLGSVLKSSTENSIVGTDLDGKIVLWNEGARRIYGYESEEVVGRANSTILHIPEDIQAGKPREMRDAALHDGKWEGTILSRSRSAARRRRSTANLPSASPCAITAQGSTRSRGREEPSRSNCKTTSPAGPSIGTRFGGMVLAGIGTVTLSPVT